MQVSATKKPAPDRRAPRKGGPAAGGSAAGGLRSRLRGASYEDGSKMLSPGKSAVPGADVTQPGLSEGHMDAKFEEVKGTPFIREDDDAAAIDYDDVAQGSLGDCYFVASLAALARHSPGALEKMIKENGDGTYTVTFAEGGPVVVDTRFPKEGGRVVYAKEGDRSPAGGVELWVMLIEKAWAKLKGGYEEIRGEKVKMARDPMQAITGQETKQIDVTGLSDADLFKRLAEADKAGYPMTLWARTSDSVDDKTREEAGAAGVIFNHAFAVVEVNAGSQTVTLYNPWGKDVTKPVLKMGDVKKFYRWLNISQS